VKVGQVNDGFHRSPFRAGTITRSACGRML
jgi:hypothetical protein